MSTLRPFAVVHERAAEGDGAGAGQVDLDGGAERPGGEIGGGRAGQGEGEAPHVGAPEHGGVGQHERIADHDARRHEDEPPQGQPVEPGPEDDGERQRRRRHHESGQPGPCRQE